MFFLWKDNHTSLLPICNMGENILYLASLLSQRVKPSLYTKDLDISKGPFTPRSSSRSRRWVNGASTIYNTHRLSLSFQQPTPFLLSDDSLFPSPKEPWLDHSQNWVIPSPPRPLPTSLPQRSQVAGAAFPGGRASPMLKWRWRKNMEGRLRARKAWNIILTHGLVCTAA